MGIRKELLEGLAERVGEMRANQEAFEKQVAEAGLKGVSFKRWKAALDSAEQKIKKQLDRTG